MIMSDRHVVETSEFNNGDHTVVTVVSEDEYGNKHVGTSSYENDTWHTDSDRESAHKEATEQSFSPYN